MNKEYRIWKYPLVFEHEQELNLPRGFRLLHVGYQDPNICLWILHDVHAPKIPVRFVIYGTGREMKHDTLELWHMGTVNISGFMWHVFIIATPLLETRKPVAEVNPRVRS